jgi:hypothetical protein
MTNDRLAGELANEFLIRGYTWDFPDGARVPTKEDLLEAIQKIKETTPDGYFRLVGRLAIVNSNGHLDIYLYQGEAE